MTPAPRIAFVGGGRMGGNMARRLKGGGHAITAVYDANPDTARVIAAECRRWSALTPRRWLTFHPPSNALRSARSTKDCLASI